jgi:hypothetical protein
VLVHVAVIGGVEIFWYLFTGGFSPLIGGFALVAAWLILVRVVGERAFGPEPVYSSRLNRS